MGKCVLKSIFLNNWNFLRMVFEWSSR